MKELRVEKTILKDNTPQYDLLRHFCFESKNLYNYANYILRNNFKQGDLSLHNFYKIREYLRNLDDFDNPWKRQAGTHIGAETLQVLYNNWQGFFRASQSFSKNPEKFKSRPRIPNYLPKNGEFLMQLDSTCFKQKGDGFIHFPKAFQGLKIAYSKENKVKQVRIIPRATCLVVEVVYEIEIPDEIVKDNNRYMSIDLGVSNFATVITNTDYQSFVMNGKGLKSINQYYNKRKAHYQEIAERMNNTKTTKRLQALTFKRECQINDLQHKMSRCIVDKAKELNISRIVIGYNPGWKQESSLGKKNNQNFVHLPYLNFIRMLQYKGRAYGIDVVVVEESFTSGTSFLDKEYPDRMNYNKSRRLTRGMFKSNQGILINADVNGAYQILKKVSPNAYEAIGVEDVSLHPIRVNVA